jgi:hypothetical protein
MSIFNERKEFPILDGGFKELFGVRKNYILERFDVSS